MSDEATPYRMHLHGRIAREIPEFQLHSLFTESRASSSPWRIIADEATNPVSFGATVRGSSTSFAGRAWEDWKKGNAVISYLKEQGVVVVIVNGYASLTNLRVIQYGRRRGIAVFLRGDSNIKGDLAGPIRSRFKLKVIRWAIRSSVGIMPMGELGVRYFEKYGAKRRDCYLVPAEPDYAFFAAAPGPDQIASFIDRHGLTHGRRRVVFSGRLVATKRVDQLIKAFAEIANKRPDWDLLIAGDGPLRTDLVSLVPVPLRRRVRWLGFCDSNDLRCAYHLSDVLVLPSSKEAWALVIFEAAAAGLVIVASDVVGAAHEIVEDGVNGRVFGAGSLNELLGALLDVSDEHRLSRYKKGVGPALDDWRQRADPVLGIRTALAAIGCG